MCSARVIYLLLLPLLAASCAGQGKDSGARGGSETQTMETKVGEPAERGRYAPGEILVKFREGTDERTMTRIQQEAHLETIRVISSPNLYLMKIVDDTPVEEMVERLRSYGEVAYAEPNYVRRIQ
jgi:hypothetical protein